MKCKNCGQEFQEQRITAKYCSKKCNTYFNRRNTTTINTTDFTDSVDSATDQPREDDVPDEVIYDDSEITTPTEAFDPDKL